MYSKEETKKLKRDFWTSFGVYMKKHNVRLGKKINWVNYNTKIKDVYFRLNVTNKKATFYIEIQHKDLDIREIYYEQFTELKKVLESNFETPLTWESLTTNDFDLIVSRIGLEKHQVNIFDKNTWKEAFLFLENSIVAAHNFWEDFIDIFKQLE